MKKSKLANLTKKDGGSLAVRDYTDDIYNSRELNNKKFIEGQTDAGMVSEVFTNLLIVVPKAKQLGFADEMKVIMSEYYSNIDTMEAKRHVDHAKMKVNELKEAGLTAAICEQHGIDMPPADSDKAAYDAWFHKTAQKMESQLAHEL